MNDMIVAKELISVANDIGQPMHARDRTGAHGYEAWKALDNARGNLNTARSRILIILDHESPDNPDELQQAAADLDQMLIQVGRMRSLVHDLT